MKDTITQIAKRHVNINQKRRKPKSQLFLIRSIAEEVRQTFSRQDISDEDLYSIIYNTINPKQ